MQCPQTMSQRHFQAGKRFTCKWESEKRHDWGSFTHRPDFLYGNDTFFHALFSWIETHFNWKNLIDTRDVFFFNFNFSSINGCVHLLLYPNNRWFAALSGWNVWLSCTSGSVLAVVRGVAPVTHPTVMSLCAVTPWQTTRGQKKQDGCYLLGCWFDSQLPQGRVVSGRAFSLC